MNDASIILVKQSASCAPLCTHLRFIPSESMSFMALAANWVRNSAHWGGAVLVTRSKRDLQSVAATLVVSSLDLKVVVVTAAGRCLKVSVGLRHSVFGFNIHAQHSFTQDNWSSTVWRETVSAARVLVTTRCIFLQPQTNGLTGQVTFLLMSAWVLIIIQPVWELGLFAEANDASENAKNLSDSKGIGWILISTSWCFFAKCRVWLPIIRVSPVALLMALCK